MKEHSSNQNKTTGKANANQSFFKPNESKGASLFPPPLAFNSSPIQKKKTGKHGKTIQKRGPLKSNSYVLKTDASSAVELGSNVNYTLAATEDGSILNQYNYNWKVIDSAGQTFHSTTTNDPNLKLRASVPGDYIVQAQILNDDEWVDQAFIRQNFYFEEKNTELGGLIVGNFDFNFDGNRALIEVRVKFSFEKDEITSDEQSKFKNKFFSAIRNKWSNSGVSFVSTGNCAVENIPLKIDLIENESDYHKLVDVEKDYRRPDVISDMNMHLNINEKTIAHEFGHVIGLYDEYDGGMVENNMFWHDDGSHHSDTSALMNRGSELRKRYFKGFLDKVNDLSAKNCKYKIAGIS